MLPRHRRPIFAIVMTAIGLAACNALTGLDAEYRVGDGDSGEAPDTSTGTPDGEPNDDGSSGVDSGIDVADAGTDGDAAKDGSTDAPNDGAPTFCSDAGSTVVFCTDFEEANPLTKWDGQEIKGGNGAISIVAGVGLGGSKAYRALATESVTDRTVSLWKVLSTGAPTAFTRYTAQFSFFIKQKTIEYGSFGVLGYVQGNSSFDPYYGLATYPNNTLDQSDPPAPSVGTTVNGTLNVWHAATMVLERSGATATYKGKIVIDGVTVDDVSTITSAGAVGTQLRLGYLFTSTDPGQTEVYFDNVIVFRDP